MTRAKKGVLIGLVALPLLAFSAFYISSCTGTIHPYAEKVPESTYPSRMIVFGDSRPTLSLEFWRPNYEHERLLLLHKLAEENPRMIINTGDLASQGWLKSAWEQFDREHAPIFDAKIPYYPCLGNHEYWGNKATAMENYFGHFPLLEGRKWYALPFLNLLFVCVDSNFHELMKSEIEAQDKWYQETLAAAEKDAAIKAVIVCTHHPPYTNSKIHGDSLETQEHFVARKTPKVRALIAGHVHGYERFVVDGVQHVVSGGGGAPLTKINVASPRHEDQFKGPEIRQFNYCVLTVEKSRLTVDVMMLGPGDQWTRGDGFVIDFP